jgi:hypothetical protein
VLDLLVKSKDLKTLSLRMKKTKAINKMTEEITTTAIWTPLISCFMTSSPLLASSSLLGVISMQDSWLPMCFFLTAKRLILSSASFQYLAHSLTLFAGAISA